MPYEPTTIVGLVPENVDPQAILKQLEDHEAKLQEWSKKLNEYMVRWEERNPYDGAEWDDRYYYAQQAWIEDHENEGCPADVEVNHLETRYWVQEIRELALASDPE